LPETMPVPTTEESLELGAGTQLVTVVASSLMSSSAAAQERHHHGASPASVSQTGRSATHHWGAFGKTDEELATCPGRCVPTQASVCCGRGYAATNSLSAAESAALACGRGLQRSHCGERRQPGAAAQHGLPADSATPRRMAAAATMPHLARRDALHGPRLRQRRGQRRPSCCPAAGWQTPQVLLHDGSASVRVSHDLYGRWSANARRWLPSLRRTGSAEQST